MMKRLLFLELVLEIPGFMGPISVPWMEILGWGFEVIGSQDTLSVHGRYDTGMIESS